MFHISIFMSMMKNTTIENSAEPNNDYSQQGEDFDTLPGAYMDVQGGGEGV